LTSALGALKTVYDLSDTALKQHQVPHIQPFHQSCSVFSLIFRTHAHSQSLTSACTHAHTIGAPARTGRNG
jgi:hypothetical protein